MTVMEAWVLFTIAAAFLQNIRNGLQKSINGVLSTTGAAYTRFAFGLPLAIMYWAVLRYLFDDQLNWSWLFWLYALIGGTAQVLAMVTLLLAFALRGFAVGTAYAKTETLQTAIFVVILLGEPVSYLAWGAIFISLIGVLLLSSAKMTMGLKGILAACTEKTALYGIASGGLLGISAVCYRAAGLSITPLESSANDSGALLPAASALMIALALQTIMMTAYLMLKEQGQLALVWRHRAKSMLVGVTSMVGSVGWFTAMTLQNAAYVRAVGQVEIVFTFLTSVLIFREKITSAEIGGTVLIVGGVLILLLG